MSSSNTHTPCAACKLQRRKCTQECVFAPYFPPDQPQKFANVHKVFGASNVGKILHELNAAHREDAVTSLAYEAESRLKNPVYGCVGFISILQDRLKQVQLDLYNAKMELSAYMGPAYHGPQQLDVNTSMHMLGVVVTGSPLQNYSGGAQMVIGKNHQHQYHHQHQQQLFNYMDVVGPSSFKQMPGGEGALDLGGPFDNN